jgi:outer membrane protein assembly factor BamD
MMPRLFRPCVRRLPRTALLLLALALPLAAGCSEDENQLPAEQRGVGDLYNSAMNKLNEEEYTQSAHLFEEVERQHPYSQWATRAQLMAAYADYSGLHYDDAIDALTRFIELHPGSPHIDYAYYMRAVCYYEQIADIRRDQKATQQAYDGFTEVIRRFPNTPYAHDAQYKRDLTLDHLAAKDMEVGRWYEGQGNYIAAVNRFRNVVENYQSTSHVPEALERLTECYLALGIRPEAQKAAAVLGYNYPDTDWYKQAFGLLTPGAEIRKPEETGLVDRIWDSLF